MCIIKTTLSFFICQCSDPIFMPIKMLRLALNYLLLYILCIIILHGFDLFDPSPIDTQHDKWWDCAWTNFFNYLTWGLQPITQCVVKYVESIQLQPHTNKHYSPHRRIYYSTRITRTLAYTAIIAMAT